VPAVVASVEAARGLVVDAGKRQVALWPVRAGRVLDAAAVVASPRELDAAVSRLSWPEASGPDDWPWLAAWLRTPRGRASYVVAGGAEDAGALVAAVRATLGARFAPPPAG
jgi:hypothetical protein